MFEGKRVLLGVTGGVAAYKSCELVRQLVKRGIAVKVIMTEAATKFVSPMTFSSLSGNPTYVGMFAARDEMEHISLARWADVFVIAPASANTIAKIAHGIADNLLTTVVLAARMYVVIAPAMNVAMWENPATQSNMVILKGRGFNVVEPVEGELACGEDGKGRLAELADVVEATLGVLTPKLLRGKHIAVTAGPTHEHIDPVRFISNPSSGKMGFAVARVAGRMGARVTLVSGPVNVKPPRNARFVSVTSAQEMKDKLDKILDDVNVLVMAAAVGDFRPKSKSDVKGSKDSLPASIEFEKNPDILKWAAKRAEKVFRVGFSADTHDVEKNAKRKLREKNCHLIVANDVSERDTGFGSDFNSVVMLDKAGEVFRVGPAMKEEIAYKVLGEVAKRLRKRRVS